jgi:hypothetical protein
MESIATVLLITIAFAAANLFVQLAGLEINRRHDQPKPPHARMVLEHPFHTRIDGMPRTRTDRRDLQLAIGHDFAAPDVEDGVWPRDPRM